ncbi:MAG: hypothetical protein AB1411_12245 [Nitrospirota bacterium]
MSRPRSGRWLRILLAGWALVAVGGAQAFAQVVPLGDAVEPAGNGRINWTTGWVFATGLGAPPAHAGPGQGRAMAERAAKTVAVRNLLEVVNGVRIDSATLVENFVVTNDVIKSQVNGFVRGAQVVKTEVQPEGGVEVTVKVPLWGVGSLISSFMDEKKVVPQELPPESATEEGPTGLVIDARGLGLKPACFPEITDDKGALVYGPATIDRPTAEKDGMVQYKTLPKGADLSAIFGEGTYVIRPVQMGAGPREGRRPLKIKGVDKAGALKANLLISSDDAKRIREDPQLKSALARSKVVVVTDPLIGGMEGRAPTPDGWLVAGFSAPVD